MSPLLRNRLFIITNKLFSPDQSAYLCGRSTQTALHAVIDSLSNNVDKGFINANCTLDMAKGFDTVSHDILLHKLSFYGFSPSSCNFFKSYLSRRSQQVKGDVCISKKLPIKIGVPQGSVSGHFVLNLYK